MRAMFTESGLSLVFYDFDIINSSKNEGKLDCIVNDSECGLKLKVLDEIVRRDSLFPHKGIYMKCFPSKVGFRNSNDILVQISEDLLNEIICDEEQSFMTRTRYDRLHINYLDLS